MLDRLPGRELDVSSKGPSIPSAFSDHALVAALRAIQAGQITHVEFLRRIMAAGCVGYFVNIAGKRAIYFGRNGESYLEVFPAP